ncbi:hypothetical protein HMI54_000580 [Coelomomyces lativittatus]|nr:hypothetical protein HMI56_004214 [Coelomomyces lativittatus]KAJ1511711.1 hypothetical protein HMI54_000580 [Coelomomyces lativittatus]
MIKANQGHSISTVTELEGIPLIDPTLPVIHATSSKCLPSILKEGLKPMRRLHIHFAEPGPLLRNTCDIHIYINMEACLRDHIEFLKAPNGVIFSSGIHGVLPPKYFLKIVPALPS